METPKNDAGRLTEEIMAAIRPHLQRDPPPQENHHYNRAFEAIYAALSTRPGPSADVKFTPGD